MHLKLKVYSSSKTREGEEGYSLFLKFDLPKEK